MPSPNEINAMPKERPILFSAPMVRAILAGSKSQTRRIVDLRRVEHAVNSIQFLPECDEDTEGPGWFALDIMRDDFEASEVFGSTRIRCPYGGPSDRLWVKEQFTPDPPIDGWDGDFEWNNCGRPISGVPEHYRTPRHCIYRAEWTGDGIKWRPSIHMPRWASRITLEVTRVRCERLQSITEDDAIAEGVDSVPVADIHRNGTLFRRDDFGQLWDIINGDRANWKSNPWVWVVEFKRLDPT